MRAWAVASHTSREVGLQRQTGSQDNGRIIYFRTVVSQYNWEGCLQTGFIHWTIITDYLLRARHRECKGEVKQPLLLANSVLCSLLKTSAPNSCPRNNRAENCDSGWLPQEVLFLLQLLQRKAQPRIMRIVFILIFKNLRNVSFKSIACTKQYLHYANR